VPTKDKKYNVWVGTVRIKGFPFKKKRGFKTKAEARKWENMIKASYKEMKLRSELLHETHKADFLSSEGMNQFKFLSEKYSHFLSNPYNTLPDLIEEIFRDFDLPYTYNDIKKIVRRKKNTKVPVSLRTKIMKRDGHRCVLCGATAEDAQLHVDHIISTDRGGLTEERNLRTLCAKCNFGKSNKPFLMTG